MAQNKHFLVVLLFFNYFRRKCYETLQKLMTNFLAYFVDKIFIIRNDQFSTYLWRKKSFWTILTKFSVMVNFFVQNITLKYHWVSTDIPLVSNYEQSNLNFKIPLLAQKTLRKKKETKKIFKRNLRFSIVVFALPAYYLRKGLKAHLFYFWR